MPAPRPPDEQGFVDDLMDILAGVFVKSGLEKIAENDERRRKVLEQRSILEALGGFD